METSEYAFRTKSV